LNNNQAILVIDDKLELIGWCLILILEVK
jgi:hypothetical protein